MVLAGGAFGGNRGARPVPPEKGVFPLDHLHECDLVENLLFFHWESILFIIYVYIFLYLCVKHNNFLNLVCLQLKFVGFFFMVFSQCLRCCCCIDLFQEKKDYLSCLKSSGHNSEKCRHLSKKYLQCRMDK